MICKCPNCIVVDVFQESDKYIPCITISFCFERSHKSHDEDRKLVSNNWDVSGWGPTKLMIEFYLAQHAQWYLPFPCNDDSNGLGFRYNMSYNYYYYYYLVSIPELSTQTQNRVGLLDGLLIYSQERGYPIS
jgi:hypothetical protein